MFYFKNLLLLFYQKNFMIKILFFLLIMIVKINKSLKLFKIMLNVNAVYWRIYLDTIYFWILKIKNRQLIFE